MKKISVIFRNKGIIVFMAILVGIGIGIGVFKFKDFLVVHDEDIKEDDKSDMNNEQQVSDNYLYRIYKQYQENDGGDILVYDYLITDNYEILSASIEIGIDELVQNRGLGTTNLNIFNSIPNLEHTELLKLNENQKKQLKSILESINYDTDVKLNDSGAIDFNDIYLNNLGNIVLEFVTKKSGLSCKNLGRDGWYAINLQDKTSFIANYGGGDFDLEIIINDLIAGDFTYLNYLVNQELVYDEYLKKDNNVEKYIDDKDYNKLNVESDIVKELYKKVHRDDLELYIDLYKNVSLTNDVIISLTLDAMDAEKKVKNCNYDHISETCYFDEKIFDTYVKRIFGPNVSYNIRDYNGFSHNGGSYCYGFDDEKELLYVYYSSGAEFVENVIGSIAYAYEKDDKLVIIEKTLFKSGISDYEEQVRAGLYESVDKKVFIASLFSESSSDFLEKYS
ncbi:MAG: hypothetical protein K2M17_01820, partial [Bacilli bacterium]|nr:hypothetical protein [Bacilli bacterium]